MFLAEHAFIVSCVVLCGKTPPAEAALLRETNQARVINSNAKFPARFRIIILSSGYAGVIKTLLAYNPRRPAKYFKSILNLGRDDFRRESSDWRREQGLF